MEELARVDGDASVSLRPREGAGLNVLRRYCLRHADKLVWREQGGKFRLRH